MRSGTKRISSRARSRMPGLIIAMAATALACDTTGVEHELVGPVAGQGPALALTAQYSAWSPAVRLESADAPADPAFNTASLDGCPFVSRDGKTFFIASDRPGGKGGTDIWVSTRANESEPWGEPVNVGEPVNSQFNDFCPTIDRDGHRFFFVSNRPTWGPLSAPIPACGGSDMYVTRLRNSGGFGDPNDPAFDEPENLGCAPGNPNSAADEASPFPLPQSGSGPVLYFSSARAGGFSAEAAGVIIGDQDIYMSRSVGGAYGPAELVPGVNSASNDGQPNVRRDGLEIFFFSTRPGTLGMADIYAATRERTSDPWSAPVNLGGNVNTAAAETRPSLSWDGTTLHFGSTRPGGEGSTDIYKTTRQSLRAGTN